MSALDTRKAAKNISHKKRYECEHCNVVCSSLYGLREHLRKHTGIRPFVCKQCNRPFKRMMGLRKHEQFIHGAPGLKQFNCPDCKVVSKSLGNAIRHCLVVHKNLRRFICSFCLAKYSQSQELKTHISSKHNVIIDNINSQEKRSICEVYVLPSFDPKDRTEDLKVKLNDIVKGEEEKLKGLETLIASIKNNAGMEQVKDVPTSQTTIKLLSRDNSEIEIQINDKENNDECPADQNIEHDIVETNSSEVLKESCPETWISFVLERPSIIYNEICYDDCIPVEIDSNIQEIHFRDSEINEDCTTIICVENNTYWKCDVCEKSFSEERKLSRHRKIHCDEKSYKCNKCDKTFQEHHNLVIHYRTHTGERPYICSICNKEIRYHKDYIDHLVSHSGEKRFTCNVCEKKFLRKRDCNRHMLSHNADSRFNCEICGKGFSRRYLMLRHILKQHNSDIDGNQQAITKQVYECDVCRKNYKTLQGFIHHKTKHTGLTEHQCHICSKSFLSATRLEAHLRNHIPRVKNVTCSECQRKFSSQDTLKIHMGRFHKSD